MTILTIVTDSSRADPEKSNRGSWHLYFSVINVFHWGPYGQLYVFLGVLVRIPSRSNCFSRGVRTRISIASRGGPRKTYSHLWFSRGVGSHVTPSGYARGHVLAIIKKLYWLTWLRISPIKLQSLKVWSLLVFKSFSASLNNVFVISF